MPINPNDVNVWKHEINNLDIEDKNKTFIKIAFKNDTMLSLNELNKRLHYLSVPNFSYDTIIDIYVDLLAYLIEKNNQINTDPVYN